MTGRRKVKLAVAAIITSTLGYLSWAVLRHGFSAREKPSRIEEFLARHARRIATPSDAKGLKNPYPLTAESLPAAREHWVEHCAICHGLGGRGDTAIGRNLYPKAPDMTGQTTQQLTDGELYYIISNGVRFTGMPAWGGEDSPEEIWQLVSFIRRLPNLSPEELKLIERMELGEQREPASKERPEGRHEKHGTHQHKHSRPLDE